MRDGGLADIAVWRSCDEVRQTMLGIITYCMVWLFAGITLHEETVSWTVGMLRNLLAKRWSIRKFL